MTMPPSSFQYDFFRIAAPATAIGLSVLLALIAGSDKRHRPAAGVFNLFIIATIGYLVCNTLEISSRSRESSFFWSRMIYPFIVYIPVIWLEFCRRFATGRGLPRPLLALFALIPTATLAIVFYDGFVGLMWSRMEFFWLGGYALSRRVHGPWFAAYAAYTYALCVAGAAYVFHAVALWRNYYRRQAFLVALGVAIPLATSLVFVFKPIPGLVKDYTPLGYAVSIAFFYVALFKRDLFALAPLARGIVVERMRDGILVLDAAGRLADANPAAFSLAGIGEEAIGAPIAEALRDTLMEPGIRELRLESPRGTRWLRVEALRLDEGARGQGILAVLRDETEQRELLAKVEELARVDALTRLPNRRYFMECATRELSRAAREGLSVVVAMIDIDRFKTINDTRGHRVGDLVLEAFGGMLAQEIRGEDLAGRLGGDEFVLLAHCEDREGARVLGERIRRHALDARVLDGHGEAIPFSLSIGLAFVAQGKKDLDALLADADTALYMAKESGRNRVVVFPGCLGSEDSKNPKTFE